MLAHLQGHGIGPFCVLVKRIKSEIFKRGARDADAMALEMSQHEHYQTFRSLGKITTPPAGYTRIRVHWVFAVKHDGRHKARLVADGHLTDYPSESIR
jgi:hypothetical protein